MTDGEGGGAPDPLNEKARPFGRWATQAFGVVALITIGVISGAKLWQPVKKVEQKVTNPIREVVKRTSPLEELPNLVDSTCPAVVALRLPGASGLPAQGVIISGDGYIVTTAAVPQTGAFDVLLNDGQKLAGTLKAHDPLSGVSLLKVDGEDLPALLIADPDLPPIGRWGALVTSPAGSGCMVEPATVASDFVTEDVSDDYYVRVHGTGSLPPPGTPFLTSDGRVLAMERPDRKGGITDRYLTADLITTALATLMRDTNPTPNPFGLIAEDASPNLADRLGGDRGRGATVVLVAKGSIAAKAGLHVGDIVLSAGNAPVSSSSELARALGGDKPIPLVVQRDGEQSTLTVTLVPKPAPKPVKARH